ncbi:hypothetical protein [Petroclostridium sp. X23]|uniref:aspartate-alanine antiporter-like transporter n=1 Tax=Petroclostridium sp. X23 TaxID=3045146 RepID=UPI0024AD5FC7|nr:hypothetical protein [Petroclostridium sp. X23]WHH60619.1 hypothetical protein QKW49_07905 [Petroclostridium sp. X23]
MSIDFFSLITSPYILIFAAVASGLLFGKIKFGKEFSFGTSGALFTGLVIGWFIYNKYAKPYADAYAANPADKQIPKEALAILKAGVIPKELFTIFLIIFVVAVGLLAAKDMGPVLKKYGIKFSILGILITFTGALVCYIMAVLMPGQNPFEVTGAYTGALTSSPGLGAALEVTAKYGREAQAAVGVGYAVAYPFGVLAVIIGVQLFPKIFGIPVKEEIEMYRKSIREFSVKEDLMEKPQHKFDLLAFFVTCMVGYIIGSIKIYMGPLGFFSLGSTGGVLIAALSLGYIGKIGILNFRMDSKMLEVLRDVSLVFFLAIVGLKYGFSAFDTLLSGGYYLVLVSLFSSLAAMFIGFIVGRYVFKINWVLLVGALCGGMTSTPGLGVAIDSINSDEPAAGYGAAYPAALFSMVLFSILLHSVPM